MPIQPIVGSLFAVVTIVYWVLQLATTFFCRRYFVQIAFLMASAVLGLWVARLVTPPEAGTLAVILSVVAGGFGLISLAFGGIKLFALPGDRLRSMNSLERSLARFSSPVKAFNLVTEDGVGVRTFDVGTCGAAFGVANGTSLTVLDLLLATNEQTVNGILYDADGSGQTSALEVFLRTLANDLYTAINEAGRI